MQFVKVLQRKMQDNMGQRNPMIAFLGDSVTQGCFEVYQEGNLIRTVFDSLSGYPEQLKKIFALLYPQAPISIVNAGVNGSSAVEGVERLRRDVLPMKPDLLVVCFGLNDSNEGPQGVRQYQEALQQIFQDAKQAGIEMIFMTPNMMNTYKSRISNEGIFSSLAELFAERQKNGDFDTYINAAREVCSLEGVTICDCYDIWKKMYNSGVDTTNLLANGLNHPVREMHYLFAWQLVYTILNG